MTEAVAAIPVPRPSARMGLSVRTLAASLLGLFAVDNILLLHFWGLGLPATSGLAAAAAAGIWFMSRNFDDELSRIPSTTVAAAFVISLLIFAVGGEGHFFYANADWQVRDAVLRDMATNPWPYAYDLNGTAVFLRAPLGTYLLPAMFGASANIAMLVLNALRLTLILALGWHLFASTRERAFGLTVFLLFSGWDSVGTFLYSALGVHLSWDHLEPWNFGYQYSSHITQAFWVPHHALAGWTCAVTFLLWRKGIAPVGLFAASIPLVAIWSPLAIMGAVPFAILAGYDVVRRRAFSLNDVAIAALAVVLALPALLYLQVDAAALGIHMLRTSPIELLACVALEVLPFTLPLLREPKSDVTDHAVVALIQLLLIIMPIILLGGNRDFQMRASIMPLALLSILFAQWVCRIVKAKPARHALVAYAGVAVALGAVTPFLEIKRAVVNAPAPAPLCSLIGVWKAAVGPQIPYATYLVPVSALPSAFPTIPVVAGRADPAQCWDRPWVTPRV
jgi:hypothetical protein